MTKGYFLVDKAHVFPIRVYFEDTDAGGIVYYANYLKFAERARTEFLRDIGLNHAQMIHQEKMMFVVKTCQLDCISSAKLDDILYMHTQYKKITGAKIECCQKVLRNSEIIATLDVVLACINVKGRPCKIDKRFRDIMAQYLFDSE